MDNKEILEKARNENLGRLNKNTYGTIMKIIGYQNRNNIIVEFQDEYKIKKKATKQQFLKGTIKNPYDKEVYNIGYLGDGKYNKKDYIKIYNTWKGMLERCYDLYKINKELSYIDCIVCDEWHNFQNFAKWYEENYYECNNERMELDKDILYKNNKIYSPKTCIFVPKRINCLFTKSNKTRDIYPIGVSWKRDNNKFQAQCHIEINNKKTMKYLGLYNTIEDAFVHYKQFKENYIKQVADEYKDSIPIKLYNALYSWEVEIND